MAREKILVVGALGTVGRSTLHHFEAMPDWDVVALSRRAPDFDTRATWLSIDLQSDEAADQLAAHPALKGTTQIMYAANFEGTGTGDVTGTWVGNDHTEINLRMLTNVIEGTDRAAGDTLRHVTLMQGGKAYGAHLGPFRMPAREDDPRVMPPNFYYPQMDYLAARALKAGWHWTILRPQVVFGTAIGSPLNIMVALGVYAAISRELGMPLRFPGGPARANEATDARLLAKAAHWAGANPVAYDQIYNIANGDVYYWEMLWPKVARVFDMEVGYPQPFSLNKVMPANGAIWDRIVEKHGLRKYGYTQLVSSWQMADFLFGYGQRPNAHHISTIKIRQHGFHDCIDTEDLIVELLEQMQQDRIMPTYS
ncbi:MAG: SDR family oxidoreductase [Sagittula sp.]|uniref:SDR family oxidoreductase n=1 Tax=Sagittula sp. TaxID=2038081 RepID=UPI0040596FC4